LRIFKQPQQSAGPTDAALGSLLQLVPQSYLQPLLCAEHLKLLTLTDCARQHIETLLTFLEHKTHHKTLAR